jgi:hypothetical protein
MERSLIGDRPAGYTKFKAPVFYFNEKIKSFVIMIDYI